MSGPGQQQFNPGEEQLNPALEAEFEELLGSITKSSVKRVLERNKVKLVTKEVTSEDALQALTQKDLEEYGLSKAAAGILKLAFPTPATAGAGGVAGVPDEGRAGGGLEVVGNVSSSDQGQVLQQAVAMMVNLYHLMLGTLQTMQSTVQPVRISASTCSDGRATMALISCGIRMGPVPQDVPCCYGDLQPAPLDSITDMVWQGKREDSVENMRKAQEACTFWVDDNELLVLDVHDCHFLSFATTTVLLEGGATDLVVVDMTLAARFLGQVDLDLLRQGVFTPTILQNVARAIYAAYECKRTSVVAEGHLRDFLPQCKVQFAALNILAGVYGALSGSQVAETTVWCGDLNPKLTMGLHSQQDMDPTGVPIRMLHVMAPSLACPPEEETLVLAAFRSSLQHTKTVRRSLLGSTAVAANAHAPNFRAPPGLSSMGAGPSASRGGAATRSSYGQTAGAPGGAFVSSSQQPQAGGGSDDVEDVPVDYHERIEFNLELQDALLETFNGPSQLQGLGLTEPELRARVSSVDAWRWLGTVGRKLAEALLERQAERQAAHACDVQRFDQGS